MSKFKDQLIDEETAYYFAVNQLDNSYVQWFINRLKSEKRKALQIMEKHEPTQPTHIRASSAYHICNQILIDFEKQIPENPSNFYD